MEGFQQKIASLPSDDIKNNYHNCANMASYLKELHPTLVYNNTLKDSGIRELYEYDDIKHHYVKRHQFELEETIFRIFQTHNVPKYRPALARDIIKSLFGLPFVDFNQDKTKIPVLNGVLDISQTPPKLTAHNKTYYFDYCLDFNFDITQQDYSSIINILDGLFTLPDPNNNNLPTLPDKETIAIIQLIFGYLIHPTLEMEKMFLFLGSGSNGKSIILDMIEMLFNDTNISALDLHDLCSKKHESTALVGSKINIATEDKENSKNALSPERLKAIISGEPVQINEKFKPIFKYRPKTKIIISSNNIPYFNDNTNGMLRRLYPIEFQNMFVPAHVYKTYHTYENATRKRVFLVKNRYRILDSINKSALFNYALEGMYKLEQLQWVLPETYNVQNTLSEYRDATDTLRGWLIDYIEEASDTDHETHLTIKEIRDGYRVWYEENVKRAGFSIRGNLISRRLKEIFRVVSYRQRDGDIKITLFPVKWKEGRKEEFLVGSQTQEVIF